MLRSCKAPSRIDASNSNFRTIYREAKRYHKLTVQFSQFCQGQLRSLREVGSGEQRGHPVMGFHDRHSNSIRCFTGKSSMGFPKEYGILLDNVSCSRPWHQASASSNHPLCNATAPRRSTTLRPSFFQLFHPSKLRLLRKRSATLVLALSQRCNQQLLLKALLTIRRSRSSRAW